MTSEPGESLGPEPTDAEIEEWATHERERREAWLRGPTQAQKAAWAERERSRRQAEGGGPRFLAPPSAEVTRAAQHYLREMQLATEGAVSLMFKTSLRGVLDQLVQAGRDWEDEYSSSRPVQRR